MSRSLPMTMVKLLPSMRDTTSVAVTVTVDKAAIQDQYDALVEEYCQKVQIKGFRKGKVPRKLLEKRFGDSSKGQGAAKKGPGVNKSVRV